MKTVLTLIGVISIILYFFYVLFWRMKATGEALSNDKQEESLKSSGRSVDWISWMLLAVAIISFLLSQII